MLLANTRMPRGVRRTALPNPDKIGCEEEIRQFKKMMSRTNVESGISSAGTSAPPGALSETRVLSTVEEDAAAGFCGVMISKDSSRSSSRSKSNVKLVKDDMTAGGGGGGGDKTD